MAKVLVTGATGFIGGHLVKALRDRGDDVTCLVRRTSNRDVLEALGCELVVGNINDSESMRVPTGDADVVYHLAAMLKQPWHPDFTTTNADGVRRIGEACAAAQVPPALVVVSSIAAAGPSPMGEPMRESVTPAPVSRYGQSKLGGERAARALSGDVPISVVRPPIVFGPRDTASLPLFKTAARGFHLVPGRGDTRLSMVHVSDLVNAIIAAGEHGERLARDTDGESAGRGIYFAAAKETPTVRELGHWLAAAVGRDRLRVISAPPLLSKIAGGIAEGISRLRDKPSIINYDKMLEANAGSWTCCADKAIEQLGWQPGADLPARLAETGAWYTREGWL